MAGSDFSYPCIIGYGSSPSRCGPSLSRDTDGRTRDLPASDAIPLHVMWPWTPAGRQHLALRANRNSRPLQCLTFRGSIPHPMQSLCTLRSRCRQRPRNTRYQANATPYLDRTFTGCLTPLLGLGRAAIGRVVVMPRDFPIPESGLLILRPTLCPSAPSHVGR